MRKIESAIIGSILLWTLTSNAQDQNYVDSILEIINTIGISDAEKVDLYNSLTDQYSNSDSVKTAYYANKAIELGTKIDYQEGIIDAKQAIAWVTAQAGHDQEALDLNSELLENAKAINYEKGMAQIYHGLSVFYYYRDQYDSALKYGNKTLNIAEKLNNEGLFTSAYNSLGITYSNLGDNDRALDYYLKSLEITKRIDGKLAISRVLNNIGGIYVVEGNYPKGLDYILESLKLVEHMEDKHEAAATYINIALIYNLLEDNESALAYLLKALKIWQKTNYVYGLAHVYSGIGSIYHELDRNEESLEYFFNSNTLCEEFGSIEGLADNYRTIALVYKDMQNFPKAIEYANKTLELSKEIGYKEYEVKAYIILGNVYCKQESFSKAKSYLNTGIALAKSIKAASSLRDGLEQLATVEQNLGNYKAAYYAQKQFKLMEDSLSNEENTKKLTRLESEYVFEQEKDSIKFANQQELFKKNTEIDLLATREDLANLRLIIGAILVSVIILIILYIARQKLLNRERKTQELAIIGQFKESLTGMIAHDLKNPLGVILGTEVEKPSTKHMARQMLNLVDNMLDINKFEKAEVDLNKQPKALLDLVSQAIEQVRPLSSKKNITIECDIDASDIAILDESYIERVLVNFLTNAIKYSPNNGTIEVFSKHQPEDGDLEVGIKDQGTGIAPENLEKIFDAFGQVDPKKSGLTASTGLGLSFCKLALEAHGSEVKVDSEVGEGTTFRFNLPAGDAKAMSAVEQLNDVSSKALSEEERKHVFQYIPRLKELKIHDAFEIEQVLTEIKQIQSNTIDQWTEEVLNAAYTNNEDRFGELLRKIENSSGE